MNFSSYLASHSAEVTALGGLFAVAVIANMPLPGSSFSGATLYKWLYDTLQAFMGTLRPRPALPPEEPSPAPTFPKQK